MAEPPRTPKAMNDIRAKMESKESLSDEDKRVLYAWLESSLQTMSMSEKTLESQSSLKRTPQSSGSSDPLSAPATPKKGYSLHILLHFQRADHYLAHRIFGGLDGREIVIDGTTIELDCRLDGGQEINNATAVREKAKLLESTMLFVPILSLPSLQQFKSGSFSSEPTNYVLPMYEAALDLFTEDWISLFPALVGTTTNGTYQEFTAAGLVLSDEKMEGYPDAPTPKDTITRMISLDPKMYVDPSQSANKIATQIADFFKVHVWPKRGSRLLSPFAGSSFSSMEPLGPPPPRPEVPKAQAPPVKLLDRDEKNLRERMYGTVVRKDKNGLRLVCNDILQKAGGPVAGIATVAGVINATVPTVNGGSCLHLACEKRDPEILAKLLEYSGGYLNLELRNTHGHTPIISAALENQAQMLRMLANAGANINAISTGPDKSTAVLILARMSNGQEALETALELGGDPNVKNPKNQGPLYLALNAYLDQSAFVLIKHGARLDNGPDQTKGDVNNIHMLSEGSPNLLAAALEQCRRNTPSLLAPVLSETVVEAQRELEPLHFAVMSAGAPSVLRTYNLDNQRQGQIMQFLGFNCASLLVAFGANVNAKISPDDLTPLHLAASCTSVDLTKMLLAAGADPNAVASNAGFTPLHGAIRNEAKAPEVIRLLLKGGSDPNRQDSQGMTPLHIALVSWIAQPQVAIRACIEELLKHDETDVNKRSNSGVTCTILFQMASLSHGVTAMGSPDEFTSTMIRHLIARSVSLPADINFMHFSKGDWVKLTPMAIRFLAQSEIPISLSTGNVGVFQYYEATKNAMVNFQKPGEPPIHFSLPTELLEFVETLEPGDYICLTPDAVFPVAAEVHPKVGDVGIVLKVDREAACASVRFFGSDALWNSEACELRKVEGGMRVGDWVKFNESGKARGWPGTHPEDFGIIKGYDESCLRVCFPQRDKTLFYMDIQFVASVLPDDLTALETPPFAMGDRVRIKPDITEPILGWYNSKPGDIGIIILADNVNGGILQVQFPHLLEPWVGYPSELEIVPVSDS